VVLGVAVGAGHGERQAVSCRSGSVAVGRNWTLMVTADGLCRDGKYGKCVAVRPIWVTHQVPIGVRIFAYCVGKLCRRAEAVRWAAIEAAALPHDGQDRGRHTPHRHASRHEHRHARRGTQTAHAGLLLAARRPHPRARRGQGGVALRTQPRAAAICVETTQPGRAEHTAALFLRPEALLMWRL
jgi:hypothetical protein